MNNVLLGTVGCLWIGIVSLALAQEGVSTIVTPPALFNQDSRHQKGPSHRYVHSPFPLKANPKKQGKDKSQGRYFPLTKNATSIATPVLGKIQLLDKEGTPVTLWPAGQKKNYPTLYQDSQK